MDVLLVNAVVYILTLLFILIKDKGSNVYVLVWSAYTINAVCGYLCVILDLHYSHDVELGYSLSIVPYLFLYICFHIIAYPFYRFDVNNIDMKGIRSQKFQTFITISFFIYIIVSIVRVAEAILISQIGFGQVYEEGADTGVRFMVFDNFLLIMISNYGNTFCTITQPILAFYFFYNIISIGNYIKNMISLAIVYIPSIAGNMAMGSKGGLFFLSLNIIFIYVFFKNSIPRKLNKLIIISGFLLGSLLIFMSSSIQESRNTYTNSKEDTWESLIRYMGESQPNLGYYYFDKQINHPYGQRFFPILSSKSFSSQYERFDYWERFTKVPAPFFKTVLGDCNVEFGFVGGVLFIIFFVWIWRKYVFTNYQKFHYFPFVCNYYQVMAICSIMGFGYKSIEQIVGMLIIFSLFIKKITN